MNWHVWVTVTSNKESRVQIFHYSLSLSSLGPTFILYQLGFPKVLNEKISDIALKTSLWTSYFKYLCLKITLTKELSEGEKEKKCFKLFVKCKKHGDAGNRLNFLGSLPHSVGAADLVPEDYTHWQECRLQKWRKTEIWELIYFQNDKV